VTADPLAAGTGQSTFMLPSGFELSATDGGAPGADPTGVTVFDAADDAPVPDALVAATVNVYGVPRVSPATLVGLLVGVTPVHPGHAGEGVTVYWVIDVPLLAGAVQVRPTVPSPFAVALSVVGAPGTASEMWELVGPAAPPAPMELVAVIQKT